MDADSVSQFDPKREGKGKLTLNAPAPVEAEPAAEGEPEEAMEDPRGYPPRGRATSQDILLEKSLDQAPPSGSARGSTR